LLLGVPFDLAGVIDVNDGIGQALFVPGGLCEVIVLPIWLIAKGFKLPELKTGKLHMDAFVLSQGHQK
jgi:hypothetical protein